jgi:ketosteroid isomerase-like protein
MSKEHVETLRLALDAFNRRDKAAWLALCDPEVENVPPRDWPESEPTRGHGAVWDFYVEAFKAWDEGALRHSEVIEAGNNKVAAHVRGEMQGKASGAGVPWSFWQVVTFRHGRPVRIEWFAERSEALEAAGLSE